MKITKLELKVSLVFFLRPGAGPGLDTPQCTELLQALCLTSGDITSVVLILTAEIPLSEQIVF